LFAKHHCIDTENLIIIKQMNMQNLVKTVEWILSSYLPPERLDDVLHFFRERNHSDMLQAVMNGWVRGKEGRHTWLTEAVHDTKFEIVAILLFYGADPNKACPLRENRTAFDGCWSHRHAQNRDRFHFMATLLNNGRIPFPRPFGHMMLNDHLVGQNPNAPLPVINTDTQLEEIPDHYDTALTFAVKHSLPLCVRWLIHGRGADVRVRNGDGLAPLELAMQQFPKSPRAPCDHRIDYESYELNLGRWKQMALLLTAADVNGEVVCARNIERWRNLYPEPLAFYKGVMMSTLS
jgi:hypothetical protein